MPAISVSMSAEEYALVKRFQDLRGTKTFSEAVQILVRRGYIAAVAEAKAEEKRAQEAA